MGGEEGGVVLAWRFMVLMTLFDIELHGLVQWGIV